MRSETICALINKKYSDANKQLVAFEVNEGTGSSTGRRADAIAFGLWPSLNYKITGFEIKVSRADWLNEMKQPEKSLPIAQFCDEFYLVAPKGVLGIDELPKTWGYIQATEEDLRVKIKAPKRKSIAPDKPFMASLLRSLTNKYQDNSFLEERIKQEKEQIHKVFEVNNSHKIRHLEEQVQNLSTIINEFNRITGLQMSKWSYGHISEAVASLKNIRTTENYINDITNQIRCMTTILEGQNKSLQILKEFNIK